MLLEKALSVDVCGGMCVGKCDVWTRYLKDATQKRDISAKQLAQVLLIPC